MSKTLNEVLGAIAPDPREEQARWAAHAPLI